MSFRTLLALLLAVSAPIARALETPVEIPPLVTAADIPVFPGEELRAFVAARRAVELGFPSVAAELYTRLLAQPRAVGADRNTLVLDLVTARLDEGRTGEAEKALQDYFGLPTSAYQLRAGLIAVRRKRIEPAKNAATAVKPEELTAGDRGWFYFLQGQLADAGNDYAKARDAYQRASDVAVSDLQRARFVLARELARLNLGETIEAQVTTLRQSVEHYQGKSVGYAYARQYAAILAARGKKAEAVAFLEEQLRALPSGARTARDDFRLMLGLVDGTAAGSTGRNALESLLADADDREQQRVALQLLVLGSPDGRERDAFYELLNKLIGPEIVVPHPILDDLLLVRAQAGLVEKAVLIVPTSGQDSLTQAERVTKNQAQAELDANALRTKFPGSPLKPAALGVLADLAWDLARYRLAADYAAQARADLPAGDTRASLGVLIAEAYFKAQDFAGADNAYATALGEVPAGVAPGVLMAQRVLSKINDGQLVDAAALLDTYASDSRLDVVRRWQAEWTLARALQLTGKAGTADAYARVNKLMAGAAAAGDTLPTGLRARLGWLQVRLALDAGYPKEAITLAEALPKTFDGLDAGLRVEIEASTQLLAAKAYFDLQQPDEALKLLQALRKNFTKADATVYSYIEEADYYAKNNSLVKAQALLTELADKFKQHAYAPVALYRAALNAEHRGEPKYYEEALHILAGLIKEYPQSELVFYALLKQGDLQRRLNYFDDAEQTYLYLRNNYAENPDELLAELALASCYRARIVQTDKSQSRFESALTILERLRDLPTAPPDLRVEAAFQLGDLLATHGKNSDLDRAAGVWWGLVTDFLLDDAQAARLGPKGRYWMSRTLLRYGDLLAQQGKLEQARNAYSLILEKNLPFAKLARETYVRAGGKP